MRMRFNFQAVSLAVAVLLVCAGPAIADTVEERLQAVLAKIEAMVTKLALDDNLDAQEADALRSDLAVVYRELQTLKTEITPEPPVLQAEAEAAVAQAAEQVEAAASASANTEATAPNQAPAEEAPVWKLYAKASAVVTPPEAKFEGWQETADISFGWGEYGQVILTIANNGYQAVWTINDAYHGSVNVGTQSKPDGEMIIQVKDDLGTHEFLLQNGGLGPLMYRVTQAAAAGATVETVTAAAANITGEAEVAAAEPATPDLPGVWYQAYREQVATGNLPGSEALEWYITQYEDTQFANAELVELGDSLRSLSGPARDTLGRLLYTMESQPRTIDIPDPRVNPASFIQVMNKVYGLETTGQPYTFTFELT